MPTASPQIVFTDPSARTVQWAVTPEETWSGFTNADLWTEQPTITYTTTNTSTINYVVSNNVSTNAIGYIPNNMAWKISSTSGIPYDQVYTNLTTGTGSITVTPGDQWSTYSVTYATNAPVLSKKDIFQQKLRANFPMIFRKRSHLQVVSGPEQKARDTLRDMLSEVDWRRYVTNGFIMVKGKDYWYQIFQNRSERVRVYKGGKFVSSICIHSDQQCPPTDHVINMKILVEIDEDSIWKGGNVHQLAVA